MPFKPGKSGNLKGRTPGSGISGELRKAIVEDSKDLLKVVIDKALEEKDATAALALLNKVIPNLKASTEPVSFHLDTSDSLTDTGESVLQAIADGSLPLDAGTQLLNGLGALARMKETDDLEQRIKELEKARS